MAPSVWTQQVLLLSALL